MPSSRSTTTPDLAEVVAPHLLDQLGVVDPLDEDAAGPGHAGRPGRGGDRAGCRHGRAAAARATGATRVTGSPSTRNPPGWFAERTVDVESVAQHHDLRR